MAGASQDAAASRRGGFDRVVRRVFPSLSRLTYNPLVKLALNAFDLPARAMFRECRGLPPNHLRVRVGVANRIFFNHVSFLTGPKNYWLYMIARGHCRLDSTIVDIGCGCGRFAMQLRDYDYKGDRFAGTYIGVDIDEEMLAWCRRNFDAARFRFHKSTDASASYNAAGARDGTRYRVPEPDGIADIVVSMSLFTHLLEEELTSYTAEAYRLLRPGGIMAMNTFCIDYPPPTYGNRHTFRHRFGNAYVESPRQPEAAVAYTAAFLKDTARAAGFGDVEIIRGPRDWQPLLFARK
jgi:SAM-dependent methyltransferase